MYAGNKNEKKKINHRNCFAAIWNALGWECAKRNNTLGNSGATTHVDTDHCCGNIDGDEGKPRGVTFKLFQAGTAVQYLDSSASRPYYCRFVSFVSYRAKHVTELLLDVAYR